MIDLGGKAAITDVGTMVFLPSMQPKLTLGDQEYLRSGVVAPSASYPDFPFVDERRDAIYTKSAISIADDVEVRGVAINGSTVALFDSTTTLYYSTDNMVTWARATLPGAPASIIVSPAGSWIFTNGVKIWKSTNLTAWVDVTPAGFTKATVCTALFVIGTRIVYFSDSNYPTVRVWHSSNDCATWASYDLSGNVPTRPGLLIADENLAVMAMDNYGTDPNSTYVLVTTDGLNWTVSTFGMGDHTGAVVDGKYVVFNSATGDIKQSTDCINWTVDSSLRTELGSQSSQYKLQQLPGAAALMSTTLSAVFLSTDAKLFSRTNPLPSNKSYYGGFRRYQPSQRQRYILRLKDSKLHEMSTEINQFVGAQQYTPNLYLRVK